MGRSRLSGSISNEFYNAIDYGRQSATGWVRTYCPACYVNGEKGRNKVNFAFNVESAYYKCWRCGFSGFIENAEHSSVRRAKAKVATSCARSVFHPPANSVQLASQDAKSSTVCRPALDYLRSRRVADRTLFEADIHYCYKGDRWGRRLVVPITNPQTSDWEGYVGRAISKDVELTYVYPSGMQRSAMLFNHTALYREELLGKPIVLVEGIFDALPYWPRAVSFLGKPARNHFDLVVAASEKTGHKLQVGVALDADAGQLGWAFVQKLRFSGVQAFHVPLPGGEDPGSLPTETFWELVMRASAATFL